MSKEILKEAAAHESKGAAVGSEAGEAQAQAPKKRQGTLKESVYPASELAANAKSLFGTRQECVAAALRAAGKVECTATEARGIVERFLKREVK